MKRNVNYLLILTEDEHAEIKSKAKKLGLSIKSLIILAVRQVKELRLG